jgi:hypothetical protein
MKRLSLILLGLLSIHALAFERTEQRDDCDHYSETKKPFFGDLHVHTSYSFDSYTSSQRNDPWDAYRYAKGKAITLPNATGDESVIAQLRRPLDFTSVTDHSEFLGEMQVCTGEDWSLAKLWPRCWMSSSNLLLVQLTAANMWVTDGVSENTTERATFCSLPGVDCSAGLQKYWSNIQQAAEEHYDRSSECKFTTFVGYEYTDAPNFKNLHRNVIYRNANVTDIPISTYETGSQNVPKLWSLLREQCLEGKEGCDVLAIPHNPNLSGGLMFPDPANAQEARDRLFFEPIVELTQHKGASECRFDRLLGRGLDTEDELCTFEQIKTDNLSSLGVLFGEEQTDTGKPVALDDFGRRNMVRNALKDGLALGEKDGINPFKMGFIGSTDTHSASPGGAEEDNYTGHLGKRDGTYRNVQDHIKDNAGGLAVVWAEENSRDAIFEGMRNRETYATSGTRPIVRFFAGDNISADACEQPDMVEQAYANGVPMGSELPSESKAPRILVSAQKDAMSLDLQRVQIIKGWLDADGKTHERVVDIAGNPDNGAGVNPDNCAPTGTGAAQLCKVWQDPDFDPNQRSFYYARVLENPSCRWSTLQCQAAGVNPFSKDCKAQAEAQNVDGAIGEVWANCCLEEKDEPFYSPVIQERAWTSPVWYEPAPLERASAE